MLENRADSCPTWPVSAFLNNIMESERFIHRHFQMFVLNMLKHIQNRFLATEPESNGDEIDARPNNFINVLNWSIASCSGLAKDEV